VFGRRQAGEEPADLYVLVQPALPGSEEFCGQLVAVVGRLFERQGLTLTGALTKAIAAAHENLRDWNRKSLREHQVGAGLSCLVVREAVAYLAQAGPSLAYFRSGTGELRRLEPRVPEASAVLGLGDELRPDMSRFELSPGDTLLVASPVLAEIADDGAVAALLSIDAEEALSELYLLTRDQPNFSVFLLGVHETEADEPQTLRAPASEADDAPVPTAQAPEPAPLDQPAEEPATLVEEPEPPQPVLRVADEEAEASFRLLEPLELAPVAVSLEDGGRQTVRLRGSPPGLRRQAPFAPSVARLLRRIPSWLPAAALLLGALVLLGWCVLPGSMQGNREERFDSLLASARDSQAAAVQSTNPADRRSSLEEANGQLAEAAAIHPDNSDVQALKTEVTAALTELNAVHELADLRPVADLSTQLTGDLSLQQLVVGGGSAYLLDGKGARVVALPFSAAGAQAKELVREGDLVGMVKAGKPVQIAWAPDADGGSLLVLDSERHLFSVRPSGEMRPLTLSDAADWRSLDGAASYGGSLYILDGRAGQVWRYPSAGGAFEGEREGVLSGGDLSGAAGLAVNGDVYVLGGSGRILRFSGGQEVAFEMEGIDRPLVSPASLIALGAGEILVTDRGNKRIVAFSPEGRFQAQYVSNQLSNPQAVAVDEVSARLYVLDGDSLYVAGLPAELGSAPNTEGDQPSAGGATPAGKEATP
jgi:hypothetical protein